jgi:hypothetical protein
VHKRSFRGASALVILALLTGTAAASLVDDRFSASRPIRFKAIQGTGWTGEGAKVDPDVLFSVVVTVPEGERGLVHGTFTGETKCELIPTEPDALPGTCWMQLAVHEDDADSSEPPLAKYPEDFFALDQTRTGREYEGHSFSGVIGPLPPGKYDVYLRSAVDGSGRLQVGQYTFAVELLKV